MTDITEQQAYEFGRSSVIDGPDETNCHFTVFATPQLTSAWEKGAAEAKQEQQN